VNDWSKELAAPRLCVPAVHKDVNLLVAHGAAQFWPIFSDVSAELTASLFGSNIPNNLNVLKSRVRFEVLETAPTVM